LIGINVAPDAPGAPAKAGRLVAGPEGAPMKPLLHLKTVVLIAYVALCTHMVLVALEADSAPLPPLAIGE
jgi:hypothetical protein